jgi:hypothetical protein
MNSIFFACIYYIIAIFLCLFIQILFKKNTEGFISTDVTQFAKNDILEYPILKESIKKEDEKNNEYIPLSASLDISLNQTTQIYNTNKTRLQVLQESFNKLNPEKERLFPDNVQKYAKIIELRAELSRINNSYVY